MSLLLRRWLDKRQKDRLARSNPLWGKPLPYPEADRLDLIEPGIKPLVEAMMTTGKMQPFASCEGHGWPTPLREAYVAFRCEVEAAASLARFLSIDGHAGGRLKLYWEVKAFFDGDYRMAYGIYCPMRQFSSLSLRPWRSRFRHDVELLASWCSRASENKPLKH